MKLFQPVGTGSGRFLYAGFYCIYNLDSFFNSFELLYAYQNRSPPTHLNHKWCKICWCSFFATMITIFGNSPAMPFLKESISVTNLADSVHVFYVSAVMRGGLLFLLTIVLQDRAVCAILLSACEASLRPLSTDVQRISATSPGWISRVQWSHSCPWNCDWSRLQPLTWCSGGCYCSLQHQTDASRPKWGSSCYVGFLFPSSPIRSLGKVELDSTCLKKRNNYSNLYTSFYRVCL